jgi:preprotein translocase subunit SecD
VPDDPGAFFGLHGPQDSKVKSGPTHEEFHFKLSKADDDAFNAWTKARVDRTMAIVFGDQILVQATIGNPLSGVIPIRVPKSIRDERLRKAIEAAQQNKK